MAEFSSLPLRASKWYPSRARLPDLDVQLRDQRSEQDQGDHNY
ncbi:MAG: hypothetical protein AB1721_00815 [Patescibacteria group bacterium]